MLEIADQRMPPKAITKRRSREQGSERKGESQTIKSAGLNVASGAEGKEGKGSERANELTATERPGEFLEAVCVNDALQMHPQ